MPWPDHAFAAGESEPFGAPPAAAAPVTNPLAPQLLRPLAGAPGLGAAFSIDPTPLDAGVQSDPGSAAGWHRIERTGGWHAILGGPVTLRSNDLLFIQRQSMARFTFAMPGGQSARDVWLAVGWQFGHSGTGTIYTLGRPSFTDAAWRARRTLFLNNVNSTGGDVWLDLTGATTGADYDTWADPELGDGCAIKLGDMPGSGVFDRIRLWFRAGLYNNAVSPTLKDLYYPTTGKPIPGTRLFVLSNLDPLRGTQCE